MVSRPSTAPTFEVEQREDGYYVKELGPFDPAALAEQTVLLGRMNARNFVALMGRKLESSAVNAIIGVLHSILLSIELASNGEHMDATTTGINSYRREGAREEILRLIGRRVKKE